MQVTWSETESNGQWSMNPIEYYLSASRDPINGATLGVIDVFVISYSKGFLIVFKF